VTENGPDAAPEGTIATTPVSLQLATAALLVFSAVVLAPCRAPKFRPAIETKVPTIPDDGEILVMLGKPSTVKLAPLLTTPFALTTRLPVVAPAGTTATINVVLQFVMVVAETPLNVTVLAPCVDPKFEPEIVTAAPTEPVVGDKLVMEGAGITVKLTPFVLTPPAFTTTLPVVAPVGTVATIEVALQLPMVVARVPLNETVPEPCVEPKLFPVIVTLAPIAPDVGAKLAMLGFTVKLTPLLFTPLVLTTTLPVVAPAGTAVTIEPALQLVIVVAAVPLNFTEPVP
jgi:hypothetical protein